MQEKKEQIEILRKKFEKITDAIGTPIDKGVLESIVYLNALNFPTEQSCDGDGDSYAWITFQTPADVREEKLEEEGKSIYWKVFNEARSKANHAIEEKFGEEYIKNLERWSDEVSDYWDKIFIHERDNHPLNAEYEKINNEMLSEQKDLFTKIKNLKDEFLSYIHEHKSVVHLEKTGRLDFAPKNIVESKGTIPVEINKKSLDLLKKFEVFLKEKYLKS